MKSKQELHCGVWYQIESDDIFNNPNEMCGVGFFNLKVFILWYILSFGNLFLDGNFAIESRELRSLIQIIHNAY